jgi:hypothetical protein
MPRPRSEMRRAREVPRLHTELGANLSAVAAGGWPGPPCASKTPAARRILRHGAGGVSIVFESSARIGPGKAKLLESIRHTGSISPPLTTWACPISGHGCCSTGSIGRSRSRS